MKGFFSLPETAQYRISNLLSGGIGQQLDRVEIFVDGDRISMPHGGPSVDAEGAMLLPTFVDMHTHIDKGHIWPRAANSDGSFESAIAACMHDRERNWNADDVRRRMEFSLRCAYAHGTRAIRTHLDSSPPQHKISWPVFSQIREEWADRIELQAAPIFGIDLVDNSGDFPDIAETVARHGGLLGCFLFSIPDIEKRLELFFRFAKDLELPVDFHVDESGDASDANLRKIAEAALKCGFEGPIVAGHCCSLALQSKDKINETLSLVHEAGIAVVSLPMCNMYLQDRSPNSTPRWRGVTLVHEMRNAGIPVAFASDNTRDPFYAYGDLDMIEVMREAVRICHLDHCRDSWENAFSELPAQICGMSANRLQPGDPADFIICNARNWSELLPRPQSDRVVVRKGRAIERTLPSYKELDDLMDKP